MSTASEDPVVERGDAVSPSSHLPIPAVYTPSYARADGSPILELSVGDSWDAILGSPRLSTTKESQHLKCSHGQWRHALVFIPTAADRPSTIIGLDQVLHKSPDQDRVNRNIVSAPHNYPAIISPTISTCSLAQAERISILRNGANFSAQGSLTLNTLRRENEGVFGLTHELQENCGPDECYRNPVSGADIGDEPNWNIDWSNSGNFLDTPSSQSVINDSLSLLPPPFPPFPQAPNSFIPNPAPYGDISAQVQDSNLSSLDLTFGDRAANPTLESSLGWTIEEPFLTAVENLQFPKEPEPLIVSARPCDGSITRLEGNPPYIMTSGHGFSSEDHRDGLVAATLAQEPSAVPDGQPPSSPYHSEDPGLRAWPSKPRKYRCSFSTCKALPFHRRSDRDRHMRRHNPRERVFVCKELDCEKRFYRRDKSLDHSRNVHSSGKILEPLTEGS
ncbi:hypothetical protein AOQ84DRAFT_434982 [Glonium stellatum]|uniref:C2H2-type domain-containing protein n=1 Tax=Glonium stellatum TaxID=574774 RepID=A0A8E2JZM3_9PEZI|nr:hypothetical protein AOQ84DRAFT_434982 [Glonium stellatum]